MKRLWLVLWLLGHVAGAHADTALGEACWDGVAAEGPLIAAWSGKLLLVSSDAGARFRAARVGEVGAVALGGGRLYVSRGRSLEDGPRRRRLPFEPTVLAAGPGGRLAAAALVDEKDGSTVVVARSSDGGETWQKLPSPHALGLEPGCCSENSSKGIVGLTLLLDDAGGLEIYGADDNCQFNYTPWRYRWSGHGWQELDSQLSDDDYCHGRAPQLARRGGATFAVKCQRLASLDGRSERPAPPDAMALAFGGDGRALVISEGRLLRGEDHGWTTLLACAR